MIVGQKMDYINMAQSITDLNLIGGTKGRPFNDVQSYAS